MNKRLVKLTVIFFAGILVCTYIARNIYTWSLPHVTLGFTESRAFSYSFFMWSKLEEAPPDSGYKWQTSVRLSREKTGGAYNPDNYTSHRVQVQVAPFFIYAFSGEVISVERDSTGADVVIGCNFGLTSEEEAQLKTGNMMMLSFDMTSAPSDNVVLRSAIQNDGAQDYILLVKEKSGALGSEFVTERLNVYVDKTSGLYASFEPHGVSKVQIMEPIVMANDKLLITGKPVRFYP